jgi:transmembrane sensor
LRGKRALIVTLPPDTPEPDPLLDEAIAWIVKLKTEDPTRADVDAFKRWRSQSPPHEAAFKRATLINQRAGMVAGRLTALSKVSRTSEPHRLSRRAMLGGGLAAAAAAAGYAIIQPPMGMWPSWQELSGDYRTAKGEQRKIELTQGVSLDLNTQTSIALRSLQDRPTIELVSGEVLVTAQRPPSGSLVMLAANGRISATKANFDARCLDGVAAVTCLEGAVAIQHSGQSTRIGTGQQVSWSETGLEASVSVDPAQITAWQTGLLIFRDRPLASVVEEVNRYRPGKILIVNPDLKRRAVNGDFEIAKLDTFITQVQQLFGAHATTLPGGLILLS